MSTKRTSNLAKNFGGTFADQLAQQRKDFERNHPDMVLGTKSELPAANDQMTHRTMVHYWNNLLMSFHEEPVMLKKLQLRDELNRVRAYIDMEKGKHLNFEVPPDVSNLQQLKQ